MKNFLLKLISFVFHPLLIPTYTTIVLLWSNFPYSFYLQPTTKLSILKIIFLGTFIFPTIMVTVLYFRKTISSFSMVNKEDRVLPYISSIIFFAMITVFLQRTNLAFEIKLVPTLSLVLTACIFVINFKFKISAHAAGMASITAFLICLTLQYSLYLLVPVLISVIASGLVCYARLELAVHSKKEVYYGYLLGFLLTIAVFLIGLWKRGFFY